jgi:hypothetical protein
LVHLPTRMKYRRGFVHTQQEEQDLGRERVGQ